MKKILLATLVLSSFNSFASFNEVECEITKSGSEFYVEIEQPFPQTSVFRRATLTVVNEGTEKEYNYTVTARRSPGFNQIQYMGAGFRLEVDHWPDNAPRWGRTYRGTLTSSDLVNNQTISQLSCRFPNVWN